MAFAGPALAQDYPNKPIKFFVGFPPGGPTHILARLLAEGLSKLMNQRFIIDNRCGAMDISGANLEPVLTRRAFPHRCMDK